MGCICIRDGPGKIIINTDFKKNSHFYFLIKIYIPQNINFKELAYYSSNEKENIIDLVNYFFFNSGNEISEEMDANFISEYEPTTDTFHYYIQRLLGYEIDEEKKETSPKWNLYINNKKIDLSEAVNNNLMISKKDKLELKYEKESNVITSSKK